MVVAWTSTGAVNEGLGVGLRLPICIQGLPFTIAGAAAMPHLNVNGAGRVGGRADLR